MGQRLVIVGMGVIGLVGVVGMVGCADDTNPNPVASPSTTPAAPPPTATTFGADASTETPDPTRNTEDPVAVSCYVQSWVCATMDAGVGSCETTDAAAACRQVSSGQVYVVCCDP